MNVALLSDIHDQTSHLLAALARAQEEDCRHLLFMGDMEELETFRLLRGEWRGPIDLVFGNNEYDRNEFLHLARSFSQTTHHGDTGDIDLGGHRVAFTHYPAPALRLAETGRYNAVFFGHTHIPEQKKVGFCLLANPGEIQGRRRPCFSVYSTEENAVRLIEL